MGIRVNIIADSIIAGDAVGRHSVDLTRALVAGGNNVRIYYENLFSRQEKDLQVISTRLSISEAVPEAEVTILQYAGWFPLAEKFKTVKGTRIFWYHGVTPPDLWGTKIDQDLLIHSRFGVRLVHASDIAVADSPFGSEELERLASFSGDRIEVIPISTELDEFRVKPSNGQLDALRHHLHLENKDVILYIGRLAGNKRVDLLVSALHLLRDRFPALVLLVVGDSDSNQVYKEYASKIREYARELGLNERVILTGKVPSVNEYYHLASVFALASEHEGFGVPLVEAMAAGVPVVACKSTAIPWVLGYDDYSDSGAGLLFTAGAPEELAICIRDILSNKALADSLIEKGHARSLVFTPERFRESTLKLLADTLENHSKARVIQDESTDSLSSLADVALREYRIHSQVPLFGKLIERIRYNLTVHLKEAYLDRIVERQVMFNMVLIDQLRSLQNDIAKLEMRLMKDSNSLQATDGQPQEAAKCSTLVPARDIDTQMLHNAIEIGIKSRNFGAEQKNYLSDLADVALRGYQARSRIPIIGRIIEWIRFNLTVHVKEAYLDRIVERQVLFNSEIIRMIRDVESALLELQNRINRRS